MLSTLLVQEKLTFSILLTISLFIVVFVLLTYQAVEHDSTLENTPSLSLQSLTEEEKVCQILF